MLDVTSQKVLKFHFTSHPQRQSDSKFIETSHSPACLVVKSPVVNETTSKVLLTLRWAHFWPKKRSKN